MDVDSDSDEREQRPDWWKLEAKASSAKDPRTRCIDEFQLISPIKASDSKWEAYYTQRNKAINEHNEALTSYDADEIEFMFTDIKGAIEDALAGTQLDDNEKDILFDCVVPLDVSGTDDGGENLQEADVLSRIYSPVRPTAVDIHLKYWYKARYYSVESLCSVSYKPLAKLSPNLKTDKKRGFKLLFYLGLEDMPPGKRWRAKNDRRFELTGTDLAVVHDLLFGESELGGKIDYISLAQLMLGSVAFNLDIARDEEGEDRQVNDSNETWDASSGSARWLASRFRWIAGVGPLERDASDTEEEEYEEEEDDDDSEYGRDDDDYDDW